MPRPSPKFLMFRPLRSLLGSGTFVLLVIIPFTAFSPLLAAQTSANLYGTVWDGIIQDRAAGKGAFHVSIYPSDYGGGATPIRGIFDASFGRGTANNSGVIEHLARTNQGWTFELVSSIAGACPYDVTAAIGRNGHLVGSYVGANECTANTGTFDVIEAQ